MSWDFFMKKSLPHQAVPPGVKEGKEDKQR